MDKWLYSWFHPLQNIDWPQDRDAKALSRKGEIRNVVRHQGVGVTVDSRFEHHLVAGIAHLRPPSEVQLDGFHQGGKFRKQIIDLLWSKPVNQPMLRPFQDILIFQKQRRSCKKYEATLGHQAEDRVCSAQARAKSRDNHRSVKDDPAHGYIL
jgi:hypothetical protein